MYNWAVQEEYLKNPQKSMDLYKKIFSLTQVERHGFSDENPIYKKSRRAYLQLVKTHSPKKRKSKAQNQTCKRLGYSGVGNTYYPHLQMQNTTNSIFYHQPSA